VSGEPAVTTVFSVPIGDADEYKRAVEIVDLVAQPTGYEVSIAEHHKSNTVEVVLDGASPVRASLVLREIEHALQGQGFEIVKPVPLVLMGSPHHGIEVTLEVVQKTLEGIKEMFDLEPVLVEVGEFVTVILKGGHVTEAADLAIRDKLHSAGLIISFA